MSDDERTARRQRGLERMGEVYSFEVMDGPGDFFGYTVEHLFGDIWEREGLSLRDRRLLLIGLMVAEGLHDTLGIQLDSSLVKGDLSPEDLREIVIFLSHYAGWPKGAGLNTMAEQAIARHAKHQARADGDDLP
jgi:4-carboxymuconolactone decarboxylase